MSYIGETSTPLFLRTNQNTSDSYKFSTSYNKSTIELKHFHFHKFKNNKMEILKIHKNVKESVFLEHSHMKYIIMQFIFSD